MDGGGRRHILLVEDDAAIREMVRLALSDEGYEVLVATDGAAALSLLAHRPPALILLDMKMPGTDGWTFARQYAQQGAARAPIIVLTAAQDAAQRADEIGAAGYLAKPFDLEELLEIIATYVS